MTVEELRRYLADKPGEAEVVIPHEDGFRRTMSLVRCKAETFVAGSYTAAVDDPQAVRTRTRMVEYFDEANRRARDSQITEVLLIT